MHICNQISEGILPFLPKFLILASNSHPNELLKNVSHCEMTKKIVFLH